MTPRQKFSEALSILLDQDPLTEEMSALVLEALIESNTVIGPRTPNHCPKCGEKSTTISIGGPMTAIRACDSGHRWCTKGIVENGHYRCETVAKKLAERKDR
jgi:hypothetical protein